jgi:hypothetical protein
MKKFVFLFLGTVAMLIAVQISRADVIADWTFQTAASTNNIIGTGKTPGATQSGISADLGLGTASSSHASSSSAWSSPAGNGSTNSWSANTWAVGDFYQFSVSTSGYTNITVSYDQTGSGTGPRDFNFQYSLDGSFFATVSSYNVVSNGFSSQPWNVTTSSSAYNLTFDLSAISSLANDSAIYFRTTMADTTAINGGSVATAGTDRVDNFTVFGSPLSVPEPTTLALAFGGAAFLVAFRRRR